MCAMIYWHSTYCSMYVMSFIIWEIFHSGFPEIAKNMYRFSNEKICPSSFQVLIKEHKEAREKFEKNLQVAIISQFIQTLWSMIFFRDRTVYVFWESYFFKKKLKLLATVFLYIAVIKSLARITFCWGKKGWIA